MTEQGRRSFNGRSTSLADYCERWRLGSRQPCYALASVVFVRPSGGTLGFTQALPSPSRADA